MLTILIGILVFVSAASIDFANTRYIMAVGRRAIHPAARWSVLQWLSSLVGFLVAIKVTLWMLPIEMLGLYCGTYLSLRFRRTKPAAPELTEHDLHRNR